MSKQPFWEQGPWEPSRVDAGCWTRTFAPEFAVTGQLANILINLSNDTLVLIECDGDVGVGRLFRVTYDPQRKELVLE
jgi:hypothetical protein